VLLAFLIPKGLQTVDIAFNFENKNIVLTIDSVVVAGWTGRNLAAVQHHIDELAELGIAPPSQVPLYYRTSIAQLTQSGNIEVLGEGTSGEVEPLLIRSGGTTYFGLASDHTDRDLEAYSVAASKQACAKPIAADLWDFDDISDHADDIRLRCWIEEKGQEVLYQDGSLADIRPLAELCDGAGLADGTAMLCGTFTAIEGVRPARSYRMEALAPRSGRTITLSYVVKTLPIIS